MNIKRKGIQKQLFVNYAMFSFIPLIIFFVIAIFYVMHNEISERQKTFTADLTDAAQNWDEKVKNIEQFTVKLDRDTQLKTLLQEGIPEEKEKLKTEMLMNADLMEQAKEYADLDIYIIGENDLVFKSISDSIKTEDFRQCEWYAEIKQSQGLTWLDTQGESFMQNRKGIYFTAGFPILDERKNFLGAAILEYRADVVFGNLLKNEKEKAFILLPNTNMVKQNDQMLLYDMDRVIDIGNNFTVYEKDDQRTEYVTATAEKIRYWDENFEKEGVIGNRTYLACYCQISYGDWIFVNTIKKRIFYQELYDGAFVAIIFFGILLLLVFIISTLEARRFSAPILDLKNMVVKVENGDLYAQVETITNDEIGDLSHAFNHMVVEIRNLLNRVREEQTQLRKYELMLLQVQINPHFLYNSLASLEWLIRMKRSEDAVNMVKALTVFFTTGLNKGKDIIELTEEIRNVESYLTIQKFRYSSKLHYHITENSELQGIRIPRLILQPFVENAIYHGIKEKDEGGMIEVIAGQENKNVIITIRDDGVGMEEEKLLFLREEMQNLNSNRSDSYGIKNVYARLKLFYGEQVELLINSKKGEGTEVTILLKGGNLENAESSNS